ncbi:MAG: hypothetical protein ACYCX4_06940 [Bacillota bacterium]
MKTRLIQEIGTRATLRVYWEGCQNAYGHGHSGIHNAHKHLTDSSKFDDWKLGGKASDYPQEEWPTRCDNCGAPVPLPDGEENVHYQISHERLYNTATGKSEPGDIFWARWKHDPEWKDFYCPWDNCNDPRGHLLCVLPNGNKWDIDGRANNCTRKEDRNHRCWVRTGEPPNIDVGKGGDTCSAGAGSILSGDYHGFLRNGELVKC